ncbi:MAG: S-DNA-T family DNA segregation ATPase FtsK/SpoIIIE [Bradymonadia bacterium]|jgi:S-DNA-T family DNA segregation ATPase FtsK/SpoIIIE
MAVHLLTCTVDSLSEQHIMSAETPDILSTTTATAVSKPRAKRSTATSARKGAKGRSRIATQSGAGSSGESTSRIASEATALAISVAAVLVLLSLVSFSPGGGNWIGWFGHHLADSLLYLFGVASFSFVMLIGAWGVSLRRGGSLFDEAREGAGAVLVLISVAALANIVWVPEILHHESGGMLGFFVGNALGDLMGELGSVLVLATAMAVGAMLLTEWSLSDSLTRSRTRLANDWSVTRARWTDRRRREPVAALPKASKRPKNAEAKAEAKAIEVDEDEDLRAAGPLGESGEAIDAGPGVPLQGRWTDKLKALAGRASAGRNAVLRTGTGTVLHEPIGDDVAPGDDPPWASSLSDIFGDVDEAGGAEEDEPVITDRHKLPRSKPKSDRTRAVTGTRSEPAQTEESISGDRDDDAPITEPAKSSAGSSVPPVPAGFGPMIVESAAQTNRKRADELDRAQQQRLQIGESLDWELPPMSFLNYEETAGTEVDRGKLRDLAATLESVLGDFRVHGKVSGICPGPVVTLFEFQPESGTKLSKISGLSDDIAMALKAHKVRIIAPIPGKGCVGIEVPNDTREIVYLKEILADDKFTKARSKLTMALGKDIEGYPVVMDLAKSPHLLIAGTTGAGKSVAVNGMIASVLYSASPDDVKLILIDPKQLEFAIYEGIPHLLLPVVTDPSKAATALNWAVQEMERRYGLMAEMRVRNLHGYNEKLAKLHEKYVDYQLDEDAPHDPNIELLSRLDEDGRPSHRKMFQLVVIVDEFADLMMVAGKEVEISVARLAQKARAAGIHCILATQRPSVDVITGLIKANFPTRLSCRLMSGTDSRTVLDTIGAENLLGMGDMLFRPPGKSELTRVHGAYVDEEELEKIVKFVNAQRKPDYDESILAAAENGDDGGGSSEPVDELYDQAVQIVCEEGFASISMIQRKLRIGYNRSARIMEEMEREGVVGKSTGGSSRREVLGGAF